MGRKGIRRSSVGERWIWSRRGGRSVEVARLLEVGAQSIYTWRRQEQIDHGEMSRLSSAEREGLRVARLRTWAPETELAVHRRAAELLKESVRPKGAFEAIAVIASEGLPVEVGCWVLDVSWSGFCAWRDRPRSPRAVRHGWLTDLVREVRVASYGSYGARRVYAELTLGRGKVSPKPVPGFSDSLRTQIQAPSSPGFKRVLRRRLASSVIRSPPSNGGAL